jgi:catechol 2,3-dioxygenase-like lactoylglutathione lyase family enzyme
MESDVADDKFDHLFIAPSNFEATQAFYQDMLGWRENASWGGHGEPRGVILTGGGISVVLAERHAAGDHSWSHGFNGQRPTIHLIVRDLDERYAEVSALHADIVVRPEQTHWGTRWFVVKDPDGNLIAYEQPASSKP